MQAGESHVMSQALVRHYASRVRMFCLVAAVLATGIVCPAPQGIAGTEEQREEYAAIPINRWGLKGNRRFPLQVRRRCAPVTG